MNEKKLKLSYVLPVMMAFFVMSFVDLVGIGVDRVKADFNLTSTMAQLIPSAAFLWFFLLSVPVGIMQDKYGKRNMLNIGMVITALGLLLPFVVYSFPVVLAGFALLGIGNTIVQVSANPLLVDVVPSKRTSSYLSFSQFIKSIGSMIGAPLAAVFAAQFGDWKILFLVFGVVSILSVVWLSSIKIEETVAENKRASIGSAFKLLSNPFIFMMFLCIFLIVGIDVGINAVSGQFIISKLKLSDEVAQSGRSVYFFGKMLGTFAGALLLTVLVPRKFLIGSGILMLISVLALLVADSQTSAMIVIFVIGLGVANIFPLVYGLTVQKHPDRTNEISGLMMMAISGGAVIPLLTGWISDASGSVTYGMFVLVASALYILLASLFKTRSN